MAGTPALAEAAERAVRSAKEGLFDDLNAPKALAALRTFMTEANAELDRGGSDTDALRRAREAFAMIDGVLDIVPDRTGADPSLSALIEERIGARRAARARRDFAEADRIRGELTGRGVMIEDAGAETRWKLT
jgi:cysteinyl-tRNA synthetase